MKELARIAIKQRAHVARRFPLATALIAVWNAPRDRAAGVRASSLALHAARALGTTIAD